MSKKQIKSTKTFRAASGEVIALITYADGSQIYQEVGSVISEMDKITVVDSVRFGTSHLRTIKTGDGAKVIQYQAGDDWKPLGVPEAHRLIEEYVAADRFLDTHCDDSNLQMLRR